MLKWTRLENTPSLEDIKAAINQDEKGLLCQYEKELIMDGEPNLKCFNVKMMQELNSAFVNTYMENVGKKSLFIYNTFLGCGEDLFNVWNGYIKLIVEILQWHKSMEGSDLPAGFTAQVVLLVIVMLDQGGPSFTNTHVIRDWCLQPFVDIDKTFYQGGIFFPMNMMNTSYLSHFILTVNIFPQIKPVWSVEA